MKIAITGHKHGLGKSLFKTLVYQGHTVRGFDIVTDFDINDHDRRQRVLTMTQGFDVFVNNAYCNPGQFEMLKLAILGNRYKHVIHVGSYVTKMPDLSTSSDPGWLEYTEHDRKIYLEQKTLQEKWISEERSKTKTLISIINPGYMKTELINNSSANQALNLADVSSAIVFQINLAKKNILIPEMDILLVNN